MDLYTVSHSLAHSLAQKIKREKQRTEKPPTDWTRFYFATYCCMTNHMQSSSSSSSLSYASDRLLAVGCGCPTPSIELTFQYLVLLLLLCFIPPLWIWFEIFNKRLIDGAHFYILRRRRRRRWGKGIKNIFIYWLEWRYSHLRFKK